MENGSGVGVKAIIFTAIVGASLVKNVYDENNFQTRPALESPPEPEPVPSELLVTQEETHKVVKEVMEVATQVQPLLQPTVNNTEGFLDGACHLRDPEVLPFLASLKALDENLLDQYLQTQSAACNGK